jgi:Ca2+-binding RTX toxin-like protein
MRTTLSSYSLPAEVERLRFVGVGDFTGTGNELANWLTGSAGNDTLFGGLGDDRMNGAAGADTMTGGDGNDRYFVDDANDQVVEAAGEGTDTVYASVNYALAAGQEIEFLRACSDSGLTLTGNELDNYVIGAAGGDFLDGGAGNDWIDGRAGNDTIRTSGAGATVRGGAGDDTILLDGSSTSFGDINGGSGYDTVRSADLGQFTLRQVEVLDTYYGFLNASVKQLASFSLFTADLADVDAQISISLRGAGGTLDFTTAIVGQNSIEIRDGGLTSAIRITGSLNDDTMFGSIFNDTLGGGNGDDVLFGNEGRDTLNGGGGGDRLNGGIANDTLTGGTGNDAFVFDSPLGPAANIDRITDFTSGSDIIELNNEYYFMGLGEGALDPVQFAVGNATGAGPQIVYNAVTGALFYDSNGASAGGATQFAILTGAPTLTASDFLIV